MSQFAVMPKEDYVAVCDFIRERLNTDARIVSGELRDKLAAMVSFTDDANATPEDMVKGSSAWVKGKKVEGNVTVLTGTGASGTPEIYENKFGKFIKISYTRETPVFLKAQAQIYASARCDLFGNAKKSEIPQGVTFTSAEGISVEGTVKKLTGLSGVGSVSSEYDSENSIEYITAAFYNNEPAFLYPDTELKVKMNPSEFGDAEINHVEKGRTFTSKNGLMLIGGAKTYDEGHNEGYEEGYNAGYKSGYNNGQSGSYNTGYDNGYNTGYDKGFADGADSIEQSNPILYGSYCLSDNPAYSGGACKFNVDSYNVYGYFFASEGWKYLKIKEISKEVSGCIKLSCDDGLHTYLRWEKNVGWSGNDDIFDDYVPPDERYKVVKFSFPCEAPKDFYDLFMAIVAPGEEQSFAYDIGYDVGYEDGLSDGSSTTTVEQKCVLHGSHILSDTPNIPSNVTWDVSGSEVYGMFYYDGSWHGEAIKTIDFARVEITITSVGNHKINWRSDDAWGIPTSTGKEPLPGDAFRVIEIPFPIEVPSDIYESFVGMIDNDFNSPYDLGSESGYAEGYDVGYDEGLNDGYSIGFEAGGGNNSDDISALGVLCDWQLTTDSTSYPTVTVTNYHPFYYLICDIYIGEESSELVVAPDDVGSRYLETVFSETRLIDIANVRWSSDEP